MVSAPTRERQHEDVATHYFSNVTRSIWGSHESIVWQEANVFRFYNRNRLKILKFFATCDGVSVFEKWVEVRVCK
jgi:hypothetical protein